MERTCTACGSPMAPGLITTNQGDSIKWSQVELKSLGPLRIHKSSGGRMPVVAWRCEACAQVVLTAEAES